MRVGLLQICGPFRGLATERGTKGGEVTNVLCEQLLLIPGVQNDRSITECTTLAVREVNLLVQSIFQDRIAPRNGVIPIVAFRVLSGFPAQDLEISSAFGEQVSTHAADFPADMIFMSISLWRKSAAAVASVG